MDEGSGETPHGGEGTAIAELGSAALSPGARSRAAAAYLATLTTPKSRRTMAESLDRCARALGAQSWRDVEWSRVRAHETTIMAAYLRAKEYAPETRRMAQCALRGVLHQAFRLGEMTADDWQRAIDLPPVRGERLRTGREITDAEIVQLGRYVKDELPGEYGVQVRALFAIGLGGGLRRQELSRLDVADVSDDRQHVRVLGKGGRERLQRLPPWAADDLDAWLGARARLELASPSLFVPISIQGYVRDARMSEMSVHKLVVKVTAGAGLPHTETHDLRRTFATRMLRRSDVAIVQRLMGHKNLATTVTYDRRPVEEAERVVVTLEGWGDERTYTRGDAPLDRAWARAQIVAMHAKGYTTAQILRALSGAGIRSNAGELTLRDVVILAVATTEKAAAPASTTPTSSP